jgi:hypothetical protein
VVSLSNHELAVLAKIDGVEHPVPVRAEIV